MLIFQVTELVAVSLLGLMFGSFASALMYRVPRGADWVKARSSCTTCGNVLKPLDLIPLFSWLMSRGKCRYCGDSVSFVYPLLELSSVVLCLIIYLFFGLSNEALFIYPAIPFLLALFVIDIKHMILPNQLVFILMIIGVLRLLYFYFSGSFVNPVEMVVSYLLGAFLYSGCSWLAGYIVTLVLKKESLGFGDVKLFFVSGLWLGLPLMPHFFMLSGVIALFYAIVWRFVLLREVFPFGPALITTFFVLVIYQGLFFI